MVSGSDFEWTMVTHNGHNEWPWLSDDAVWIAGKHSLDFGHTPPSGNIDFKKNMLGMSCVHVEHACCLEKF